MKSTKPWLTPNGNELALVALREICPFWDKETWEDYLTWFEGPQLEMVVPPPLFKKLSEEQLESIFIRFAASTSTPTRHLCRQLLASLPPFEAKVLRLAYFGGRTFRQIGAVLGVDHSTAIYAKKRAFARLRERANCNSFTTRHYIGEEVFSGEGPGQGCLADILLPAKKMLDRNLRTGEAQDPKNGSRHRAFLELAEDEQKILRLRDRGCPLPEIAAQLGYSVNVVAQIADAARSRLERKVIYLETGIDHGAAIFKPLTAEVVNRCEEFLRLVEAESNRERVQRAVAFTRAYLARGFRHWTRAAQESLSYGILKSLDGVWEVIPRRVKRARPEVGDLFDQLSLRLAETCHGRLMQDFENKQEAEDMKAMRFIRNTFPARARAQTQRTTQKE